MQKLFFRLMPYTLLTFLLLELFYPEKWIINFGNFFTVIYTLLFIFTLTIYLIVVLVLRFVDFNKNSEDIEKFKKGLKDAYESSERLVHKMNRYIVYPSSIILSVYLGRIYLSFILILFLVLTVLLTNITKHENINKLFKERIK